MMAAWLRLLWTVTSIDLRQRVRGAAWYVLLGVFVALVFAVTALATIAVGFESQGGGGVYSTVIFFVLLLASLVSPALSGNAINGDRDAGTLATTQVTLVTTTQLLLGKLLASWITALAFLVAAVPFILYTFALGGVAPRTVAISIGILTLELLAVAAFGVGLSGLLRRPLFSIVVAYLVVALFSVGTLIAFGLGGLAIHTTFTQEQRSVDWNAVGGKGIDIYDPVTGVPDPKYCTVVSETRVTVPRFDAVWWMLAANPYVVLADAVPTAYGDGGYPSDLFGVIKLGVRSAQLTPQMRPYYSDCEATPADSRSPRAIIDSTVPGWAVGLAIELAIAAALMAGAIAATRAPARRLGAGSRIA